MKIEHVAFNVSDPAAMANWYRDHLGLTIVRRMEEPPFTHFLRDSGGTMLVEVYRNPPDSVPSYRDMHPLTLHLAFISEDPEGDKAALIGAGATLVEEQRPQAGSHLVMMRDPWGFSIQLCKRSVSMFTTPGTKA